MNYPARLETKVHLALLLNAILVLFWSCDLVLAQIVKLTDESSLSEEAVSFSFEMLPLSASAIELYTAYGIRFGSEGAGIPTVRNVDLRVDDPTSCTGVLCDDKVIRNEPHSGSSADLSFILQLQLPLRRVGFTLGNGADETVASIRAFTAAGTLLGAVEQGDIKEGRGPFVGVETSHPEGIATVVLSYGQDDRVEQINDLVIDYLTPRKFQVYVPRVVHGRAGDRSLQSTIQIQNLRQGGAEAEIRFFDSAGNPLSLMLDGEEGTRFEFFLDFLAARQLTTNGPIDELKAGYAVIESNYPVAAQTIFQVLDETGVLVSEAGIHAAVGRIAQVSPVQKELAAAIDTGIAITNTGSREAIVRLTPREEDGRIPEEIFNRILLQIPPGGHRAFFLSELCQQPSPPGTFCQSDFLASEDFRGSLEIASNEPTVVTTIRTVAGMPVSSLPVGSTEE